MFTISWLYFLQRGLKIFDDQSSSPLGHVWLFLYLVYEVYMVLRGAHGTWCKRCTRCMRCTRWTWCVGCTRCMRCTQCTTWKWCVGCTWCTRCTTVGFMSITNIPHEFSTRRQWLSNHCGHLQLSKFSHGFSTMWPMYTSTYTLFWETYRSQLE